LAARQRKPTLRMIVSIRSPRLEAQVLLCAKDAGSPGNRRQSQAPAKDSIIVRSGK